MVIKDFVRQVSILRQNMLKYAIEFVKSALQ